MGGGRTMEPPLVHSRHGGGFAEVRGAPGLIAPLEGYTARLGRMQSNLRKEDFPVGLPPRTIARHQGRGGIGIAAAGLQEHLADQGHPFRVRLHGAGVPMQGDVPQKPLPGRPQAGEGGHPVAIPDENTVRRHGVGRDADAAKGAGGRRIAKGPLFEDAEDGFGRGDQVHGKGLAGRFPGPRAGAGSCRSRILQGRQGFGAHGGAGMPDDRAPALPVRVRPGDRVARPPRQNQDIGPGAARRRGGPDRFMAGPGERFEYAPPGVCAVGIVLDQPDPQEGPDVHHGVPAIVPGEGVFLDLHARPDGAGPVRAKGQYDGCLPPCADPHIAPLPFLAGLQEDVEPARGRAVVVHPGVEPDLLSGQRGGRIEPDAGYGEVAPLRGGGRDRHHPHPLGDRRLHTLPLGPLEVRHQVEFAAPLDILQHAVGEAERGGHIAGFERGGGAPKGRAQGPVVDVRGREHGPGRVAHPDEVHAVIRPKPREDIRGGGRGGAEAGLRPFGIAHGGGGIDHQYGRAPAAPARPVRIAKEHRAEEQQNDGSHEQGAQQEEQPVLRALDSPAVTDQRTEKGQGGEADNRRARPRQQVDKQRAGHQEGEQPEPALLKEEVHFTRGSNSS